MGLMERLPNAGVVPVVVLEDAGQVFSTTRTLLVGDIDVMEIMLRTDTARNAVRIATEQCPDMPVGADIVCLVEQCRQVAEAEVWFTVSPGFDPCMIDWCLEHKLTVLLGCVTLGEIMEALSRGIDTVKSFPANVYGDLKAMKALSGPFAGLQFAPIGGINTANLAGYARASFVRAVGGSWLYNRLDIVRGRLEHIVGSCRQAKDILVGPQGQKNGVVQTKYLTSGEITLHLRSLGRECLFQSGTLEATFGDGETNVAVSLISFDVDAAFLTILLDNSVGSACMGELRRPGVDTGRILTRQGRMDIYFLKPSVNQRPSRVMYDRAGSAIVQMVPSEIDWDQAFAGIGWFHATGTTPALSESAMELSPCAVRETKVRSVTASCDLNYRKDLWRYGKEALQVMRGLTESVDVATANEENMQKSLGASAAVDVTTGQLDRRKYRALGDRVLYEFPNLRSIVITLWESVSAGINGWSACLNSGNKFYISRRCGIQDIVDRAGGGDNFAAGLIYRLTYYQDHQEALELAVATSCLKHSIPGDFDRVGVVDVGKLTAGDGSGRVRR